MGYPEIERHYFNIGSIEMVATTKTKVEYFNGIKPSGYFAPQIVTTKMALSGEANKVRMAWFAEIFVDDCCIFRESYTPADDNWDLAEKRANQQLIKSIFCHGVMSAKRNLEDIYGI